MKRYIEEYGLIMTVVAAVLLLLLFYKTGIAGNVKNMFVEEVKTIMTSDPANDKQVVMVRYEDVDGNFGDYEQVESKYVKDGEPFSWSFPESDTFKPASVSYTVNGGKVNKVDIKRQEYGLDVNGLLDGHYSGSIDGYGTFDLYINDKCIMHNKTDAWPKFKAGSTYEIKNIKANDGKEFIGVADKSQLNFSYSWYHGAITKLKGTINKNPNTIATDRYYGNAVIALIFNTK